MSRLAHKKPSFFQRVGAKIRSAHAGAVRLGKKVISHSEGISAVATKVGEIADKVSSGAASLAKNKLVASVGGAGGQAFLEGVQTAAGAVSGAAGTIGSVADRTTQARNTLDRINRM
tara:strand:+ start:1626 stop:1976 length:351 start_codon:yes stop_codon:yes gene_type:complete